MTQHTSRSRTKRSAHKQNNANNVNPKNNKNTADLLGGEGVSVVRCMPEVKVPQMERIKRMPKVLHPSTRRWTITQPEYFAGSCRNTPPAAKLPLPPSDWLTPRATPDSDAPSSMEGNLSFDQEDPVKQRLRLDSLSSEDSVDIVPHGAMMSFGHFDEAVETSSLASESCSECKWSDQGDDEASHWEQLGSGLFSISPPAAVVSEVAESSSSAACQDWSSIVNSWGYSKAAENAGSSYYATSIPPAEISYYLNLGDYTLGPEQLGQSCGDEHRNSLDGEQANSWDNEQLDNYVSMVQC